MDKTENTAKKDYCAPMHTAEHILNQTMVRMFNCSRSYNAHIETKKSKCDYQLEEAPTETQITEIQNQVNIVISQNIDISEHFVTREEASSIVDLSKLPENAGSTLRIIKVGDYDACACIGQHVANTSEIGTFSVISHDFTDGRLRLRWKVVQ